MGSDKSLNLKMTVKKLGKKMTEDEKNYHLCKLYVAAYEAHYQNCDLMPMYKRKNKVTKYAELAERLNCYKTFDEKGVAGN